MNDILKFYSQAAIDAKRKQSKAEMEKILAAYSKTASESDILRAKAALATIGLVGGSNDE